MLQTVKARPEIRLKPEAHKRLLQGHPWVFSNEIVMDPEAKALKPGAVVRLISAGGEALGTAIFNRRPLIAARLLSRDPEAAIDEAFFVRRLEAALRLRARFFDRPFYRMIHAESDGLPGTILDRFGDCVVLQVNTAGMDRLLPELLAAVERVLAPVTVVLRNDTPAREMEGLASEFRIAKGRLDGPVELVENGVRFLADLREGQKTGWFFDQRRNRARVAEQVAALAATSTGDARVLDLYCFSGGFAVQAAAAGAAEVTGVDRSDAALDLARQAAALNGVAARCRFEKREVLVHLGKLAERGETFDVVVCDPPAFIKSKKDYWQGLKGYRKLTRLAARLVAPGGLLFVASCSHHADPPAFTREVGRGLAAAGREGRILVTAGAAPDHPVHPAVPETAYLKAQLLALD